jgi:hypothetical protein
MMTDQGAVTWENSFYSSQPESLIQMTAFRLIISTFIFVANQMSRFLHKRIMLKNNVLIRLSQSEWIYNFMAAETLQKNLARKKNCQH